MNGSHEAECQWAAFVDCERHLGTWILIYNAKRAEAKWSAVQSVGPIVKNSTATHQWVLETKQNKTQLPSPPTNTHKKLFLVWRPFGQDAVTVSVFQACWSLAENIEGIVRHSRNLIEFFFFVSRHWSHGENKLRLSVRKKGDNKQTEPSTTTSAFMTWWGISCVPCLCSWSSALHLDEKQPCITKVVISVSVRWWNMM